MPCAAGHKFGKFLARCWKRPYKTNICAQRTPLFSLFHHIRVQESLRKRCEASGRLRYAEDAQGVGGKCTLLRLLECCFCVGGDWGGIWDFPLVCVLINFVCVFEGKQIVPFLWVVGVGTKIWFLCVWGCWGVG